MNTVSPLTPAGDSVAPYDRAFFDDVTEIALQSARAIVPMVVDLVGPQSVVDVGCGTGPWLRAFVECGAKDVLGVDGAYVELSWLLIPADQFRAMDLAHREPLGRKFDLAVCLEVGEHLPAAHANGLVQYLTEAAPVVLFSAAPPGQGGMHHVNEQWPEYWEDRFQRNGYVMVDALRHRIWHDEGIAWWYRQNLLLFIKGSMMARYPQLLQYQSPPQASRLTLIDLRVLRNNIESSRSLRRVLAALPSLIVQAIRRRIRQ